MEHGLDFSQVCADHARVAVKEMHLVPLVSFFILFALSMLEK